MTVRTEYRVQVLASNLARKGSNTTSYKYGVLLYRTREDAVTHGETTCPTEVLLLLVVVTVVTYLGK